MGGHNATRADGIDGYGCGATKLQTFAHPFVFDKPVGISIEHDIYRNANIEGKVTRGIHCGKDAVVMISSGNGKQLRGRFINEQFFRKRR